MAKPEARSLMVGPKGNEKVEAAKSKRECIFCKIIDGTLPSTKVLESDRVFAFKDISPQAPVHLLIVPKAHIADLKSVESSHGAVIEELFKAVQALVKKFELDRHGFRTVFNTGEHACQTVFHLHLHLLGGAQMGGSMVG